MTLLDGLNPPQLESVTTRSKSVLVLAGAGAGKTKSLTHRAAYLISERGVSPHNILLLTFTRKAAQEMKDRLSKLLDEKTVRKIWIGTFHAISLRILEQYGSKLGYSQNISVYDEIDQEDIVTSIIGELGLKLKPKDVLKQLHSYAADCDGTEFEREAAMVITEYRNQLKGYNAVDFSLLLTETLALIRNHQDVYEYFHNRFQHVMVDEYQDVDRTQYYLHEALRPNNIFVVGDFSQAIYSWRGSDIQIILDFEKSHEGSQVIKLEQSFRCPSNVIQMANRLIANNPSHYDKTLWTENPSGPETTTHLADAEAEASFITDKIRSLVESGTTLGDIGILTRTHAQHEALAQKFDEEHIAYKLVGKELRFWKTAPARIILSILKLLRNRKDGYHFKRVCRSILYPMSDSEWLAYESLALRQGKRVIDLIMTERQAGFAELYRWYHENEMAPLTDVVLKTLELVPVVNWFEDRKLFHKAGELMALGQHAAEWEALNESDQTIPTFLEWASEQEVQTEVDSSDAVKIATIHAVKGLEFPVVFVAGLNEGRLPHQKAVKIGDVSEERRLCYVAVTRARRELHLSYCRQEYQHVRVVKLEPSRFLAEMARGLADEGVLDFSQKEQSQ